MWRSPGSFPVLLLIRPQVQTQTEFMDSERMFVRTQGADATKQPPSELVLIMGSTLQTHAPRHYRWLVTARLPPRSLDLHIRPCSASSSCDLQLIVTKKQTKNKTQSCDYSGQTSLSLNTAHQQPAFSCRTFSLYMEMALSC